MIWALRRSEIAAAMGGALLAVSMLFYRDSPVFSGLAVVAILLMVLWIAVQDAADFTIPDGPLIALGLVGAASRFSVTTAHPGIELLSILLDAALCGGALLMVREVYYRLRGIDGLGFGDVKLAAVGGILLGTIGFAWALCLASLAGLLVAVVATRFGRSENLDRLPFGAFLAPLCWCLWIFPIDAAQPGML